MRRPVTFRDGEGRANAGLFALGLSSLGFFQGVGTLYLLDILLAGLAAWFLVRNDRPIATPVWWLLVLTILWLFGAVVTDGVRATSAENAIRGWAKISFFIMALFALSRLTRDRPRRLAAFLLGLAAGVCVQTLLFPNAYQSGLPWKFGYATPLALLSVVVASMPLDGRPPSFPRQVGPPLIMALINLACNFRSLFAVLIAVVGVTILTHLARTFAPGRRVITWASGAALIATFVVAGVGIGDLYGRLASGGVLGPDARQKYEMQTQGDLNLLLGGRGESFASIEAIKDSPLIGHGSWAENRHYIDLMVLTLREHGRKSEGGPILSALIPSHSYFFGAWVEAGIAGALFWFVSLLLSLAALLRLIDLQSPWTPFLAYCCAQLLWNIPFSPFGADVRFSAAAQLLAAAMVLVATRGRAPAPARARPRRQIYRWVQARPAG